MAILNCLDNMFKHIKKYTHFMADLSGIGARVCVVMVDLRWNVQVVFLLKTQPNLMLE